MTVWTDDGPGGADGFGRAVASRGEGRVDTHRYQHDLKGNEPVGPETRPYPLLVGLPVHAKVLAIAAMRRFPSAQADGAMIARQFIGWDSL